MQLKRQPVEASQNEKIYSKENNTSENPIRRQEIFKSVDHVEYKGQVRSQHLLSVPSSIEHRGTRSFSICEKFCENFRGSFCGIFC